MSPSTSMAPTSIGRLAGHGSGPGWSPKPRSLSMATTSGRASGVVAMARSMMPLPGRPGTAVLPMCSTTRSGRRSLTSSPTARATSRLRGSQGLTVAGSRTYGPIGWVAAGSPPECRLRPMRTVIGHQTYDVDVG